MNIQNINWNYPTSIWFGLNRIKEIQKVKYTIMEMMNLTLGL